MRPAISSEKKTAIATRKKYRASTREAIVEARSGKRGGTLLLPHHDDDERGERQHCCSAGNSDRAHDREAVPAGHGVVVIAVEQQRIDCVADLPRRRLHERVTQIARPVLDAEEIPREAAVR